jgi:hypothetical protein
MAQQYEEKALFRFDGSNFSIFVLFTVTCRIFAFELQQWLRGNAAMFYYTYIAYLV